MSRNYFLVTAWVSTPKSIEYVWERVIDRAKLGKKTDAVFGITTVDKDYVDNAAERALAALESRIRLLDKGLYDPKYVTGLEDAVDILKAELAKYHGE